MVHLDGSPMPDTTVPTDTTFRIYSVSECGLAGYQTAVAVAGSKVAFATLAETSGSLDCQLEDRKATAPSYNICVVLPSAAGFSGTIATTQAYVAKMGVGIAFDGNGVPVLAYTGGPSGGFRCGGSDMLLATVSGGTLGAPQTIAADSQSSGMPADQKANCVQQVCDQGDATGYWPAIALDPVSHNLGVAFRDLHFGFADTDFKNSDVEYAFGPGYAFFTVDVARGGGTYNRLAFSPTGKAVVVHYSLDNHPTVWIDQQIDQTT